ncbi:MAG: hypothetical protein RLZZ402_1165 [Bacteroidota bacterium]|jgi:hypothetical protein
MPCFSTLTAFLTPFQINSQTGKTYRKVSFKEDADHSIQIQLPCGQCIGCRLEKSKQWAVRCMNEAQMHTQNCFITLTYDDAHLPGDQSLHHRDFQLFLKRLRFKFKGQTIRYYMAGEYGENYGRPHFHACIFGWKPSDLKIWKKNGDNYLYRSEILESLWVDNNGNSIGYSSVGNVTFESAAYVARYIMKKQNSDKINPNTGKPYNSVYDHVNEKTGEIIKKTPEYNKMSLKPGIGATWIEKYMSDVYPHGEVIIRGNKKVLTPKYYDKIYKKTADPYIFDEMLYIREKNAKLRYEDNTPERLEAKRKVMEAGLKLKKRVLT